MSSVPPSLKSKFELCLNNDDLSDCEFVVGKQKCKIKGHKLLFGISSPVFRAMLYDGLNSYNSVTFEIKDVEADEFNSMKQFFYTDSVVFTSSLHACSVYLASWKYVIPDLMSKCVQYIKDNISVKEVIDVYEFSRLNNIPDIETICSAVFQGKTREIMQSERFLSADIHTLETILKLDSLKLNSELEVFKYTEKWVLAEASRSNIDLQQPGEHFNSIKKHIRFLTMSKDQYLEDPSKSGLLTAEEKLSIAHNLLGSEKVLWPQKLCIVTDHRIFTEEEEEEDKRLNIPKNTEKFKFIFSVEKTRHDFKYQGLELEIYVLVPKITIKDKPIAALAIVLKFVNKHKIKLHSVEKMQIVRSIGCINSTINNTIFENVSTIEKDEHIFPYISLSFRDGPATDVEKIIFELNLSQLEESV